MASKLNNSSANIKVDGSVASSPVVGDGVKSKSKRGQSDEEKKTPAAKKPKTTAVKNDGSVDSKTPASKTQKPVAKKPSTKADSKTAQDKKTAVKASNAEQVKPDSKPKKAPSKPTATSEVKNAAPKSDKDGNKTYSAESSLPGVYGASVHPAAVTIAQFIALTASELDVKLITPTLLVEEVSSASSSSYFVKLVTALMISDTRLRQKWFTSFPIDYEPLVTMMRLLICRIHTRALADSVDSDEEEGQDQDQPHRQRSARHKAGSGDTDALLRGLRRRVASVDNRSLRMGKEVNARRDKAVQKLIETMAKGKDVPDLSCFTELQVSEFKPAADTLQLFGHWHGHNPLAHTHFDSLSLDDKLRCVALLCEYRALTPDFLALINAATPQESRCFSDVDARNVRYSWLSDLDWCVYGQLEDVCCVSDLRLYSDAELESILVPSQPAKRDQPRKPKVSEVKKEGDGEAKTETETEAVTAVKTEDDTVTVTSSVTDIVANEVKTEAAVADTLVVAMVDADVPLTDNTAPSTVKAKVVVPPASPLRRHTSRAFGLKQMSASEAAETVASLVNPRDVPSFVSLHQVLSPSSHTLKHRPNKGQGVVTVCDDDVRVKGSSHVEVSVDQVSQRYNADTLNTVNYVKPDSREQNKRVPLNKVAELPELFVICDSEEGLKSVIKVLAGSRHKKDVDLSQALFREYNQVVGGCVDPKTLKIKASGERKCDLDNPVNMYVGEKAEREKNRKKEQEEPESFIRRTSDRTFSVEMEKKKESDRLQQILDEERKREKKVQRQRAFTSWIGELVYQMNFEAAAMGINTHV